jgi:hypothetical protein
VNGSVGRPVTSWMDRFHHKVLPEPPPLRRTTTLIHEQVLDDVVNEERGGRSEPITSHHTVARELLTGSLT